MPIQAVEVALRNNVNLALSNVYTPNWWECRNLYDLLDEERRAGVVIKFPRKGQSRIFTSVRGEPAGTWL